MRPSTPEPACNLSWRKLRESCPNRLCPRSRRENFQTTRRDSTYEIPPFFLCHGTEKRNSEQRKNERAGRKGRSGNQKIESGWARESECPARPLQDYSELPRWSLATGVNLPNKPSFSSFGPAVKYRSLNRPEFGLPPPKLSAHRPSIQIGAPLASRRVTSRSPLTAL